LRWAIAQMAGQPTIIGIADAENASAWPGSARFDKISLIGGAVLASTHEENGGEGGRPKLEADRFKTFATFAEFRGRALHAACSKLRSELDFG